MKHILFAFTFFVGLFIAAEPVLARIDIVPQKIIIGSRERSGELTVLNLHNKISTFRVEIITYKQSEDGTYNELQAPLDARFDPGKIVRFSPRQFSIAPGGRQKIRLSLRKPAGLPEGEYRFHIKALRFADEADPENTISVMMNTGVTIPVVVRHGNLSSNAEIESATIIDNTRTKTGKPELHARIKREGNASTIGKLEVFWKPQGRTEKKIGRITNMNIFTDINHRDIKLPLYEMPLGPGTVKIVYTDEIDKGKLIDEFTLQR